MTADEFKDAVSEAIVHQIPFEMPNGADFEDIEDAVNEVAAQAGYVKCLPHEFKDRAWAFHLSPEKGLRWGYVRNGEKVGWYEGRESTPLPQRDVVVRDAEPVYALQDDLL